jgi:hypothetical protein
LRYLATIYKRDPDASVRELAIRAGRHIKKMRAAGDWVGEGAKERSIPQAEEVRSSSVSAVDQERAKSLMDKALDDAVKGTYDRAEQLARQAFQLNPNLQYDSYYAGIASEVMGMEAQEAIAELLRNPEE